MNKKIYRKNMFSKIVFVSVIALGVFLILYDFFLEKNNLIAYCVLLGAAVWNRLDSRNKAYKASAHFGPVNVDLSTGAAVSDAAIDASTAEDVDTEVDDSGQRGRKTDYDSQS